MKLKSFVAKELAEKAKLFDERNAVYGDNYKHFGKILFGMFPHGLDLRTEEDFNRIGLLIQVVSKLSRYAQNFHRGGHDDSLDDTAVYAMMTKEMDVQFRRKKVKRG